MIGGPYRTPVLRVPAPVSVPVVRVPVPTMPAVVRSQSLGPIGPAGPQGAPGVAKRFGTIDYTDNDAVVYGLDNSIVTGTPLSLPVGQWVRVVRNLSPSTANFNLPAGPWAGFGFWDNANSLLRARATGDVLLLKFTYTVVPAQKNGGLRFAVRPGDDPAFDFGPEPIVLTADAGEAQSGSETFMVQCRSRFVNAGAYVYLMATSGATLLSFSPEVTPIDPAPGA